MVDLVSPLEDKVQNAVVAALNGITLLRVEVAFRFKLCGSSGSPESQFSWFELDNVLRKFPKASYLVASTLNSFDRVVTNNDGTSVSDTFKQNYRIFASLQTDPR